MPLQSGSDTVLKLMRRRYDAGLYASRVAYIKSKIPDACIGVDVITGHPGETESYFLESVSFIESLDVSYLHVFTYSERPDTHALALRPIIEKSERKNRTHHYRMLSGKKRRSFDLSHLNSTREVLFESTPKNDVLLGWTDNYIRVAIPYTQGLENRIVPLKLSNYTSDGYYLEQISSEIIEELCTIDSLINL
jgi:threonylcarbamoyladenosine tRNA methylthiotransferase MtaB